MKVLFGILTLGSAQVKFDANQESVTKNLKLQKKAILSLIYNFLGQTFWDAQKVQGFFSLIETKYSKMNHHQAMMDFMKDGNGLFKVRIKNCLNREVTEGLIVKFLDKFKISDLKEN